MRSKASLVMVPIFEFGTEAQRQAFVHYRALFEKLLKTQKDNNAPQETSA